MSTALAAPARPGQGPGSAANDQTKGGGKGTEQGRKIIAIPIDPMFKDKEPCRRHLAGICPNEAKDCKFMHYIWPAGKTTVCTWFNSKGKGCSRGDNCNACHIAVWAVRPGLPHQQAGGIHVSISL